MSYNVDWKSGGTEGIPGKTTIVLPERTVNTTSTSLALTGKKTANYGEIQQENFIKLLENFASNTAPANPTIGQLWFCPDDKALYLCVETSTVEDSSAVYFESGLIGWVRIWEATALESIGNEISLKANINSPTLTGTPKAPTASIGTDSTQIATTAFVTDATSGYESLNVDGHDASNIITLTESQALKPILLITGTLTGNINIHIPHTLNKILAVSNRSTGGSFTVTLKKLNSTGVVSATSVLIPRSTEKIIFTTPSNIYDAEGGLVEHSAEEDPHPQYLTVDDGNALYSSGNATLNLTGDQTIAGTKTFSSTIVGSVTGNAGSVTNGVYMSGNQTIAGTKTFSSDIVGSVTGNAGSVTNGVYTAGDQNIAGTKTFSSAIVGSVTGNAGSVTNGVYTAGDQNIAGTKTFSTSPLVPTPASSDDSQKVATTAFVKDVVSGATPDLSGVVYTSGNQTIAGNKTFTDAVTANTFVGDGSGLTNVPAVSSLDSIGIGQTLTSPYSLFSAGNGSVTQNTTDKPWLLSVNLYVLGGRTFDCGLYVSANSGSFTVPYSFIRDTSGSLEFFNLQALVPPNYYVKLEFGNVSGASPIYYGGDYGITTASRFFM